MLKYVVLLKNINILLIRITSARCQDSCCNENITFFTDDLILGLKKQDECI